MSEAAAQVVKLAHPGSGNDLMTVLRRPDLEQLLSTVDEKKPVGNVYFYQVQAPPHSEVEAPSWVVAVTRSAGQVYDLYSFEAVGGSNAPLQEFNRLISKLGLSIPQGKATTFGRLFLESCTTEGGTAIVADADGAAWRLAVQNYYFTTYGDIWRALDGYTLWWRNFQAAAPAFAPTIGTEANGSYHVALRRLILIAGRHPQVQDLDLEISPEGNVRILKTEPIFPKQPRSLFYDSPAEVPPNFIP